MALINKSTLTWGCTLYIYIYIHVTNKDSIHIFSNVSKRCSCQDTEYIYMYIHIEQQLLLPIWINDNDLLP